MNCSSLTQPGAATAAAPITAPDPDGLLALALELMDDNPFMSHFEAVNRAAEMLDELDAVAAAWDAGAAAQGHPDGMPLFISLIETAA